MEKALDMASRSCDAAARCACYNLAVMALRVNPETLPRRLSLSAECNTLARSTGHAELLADAYHWQALNYFEAGHVDEGQLADAEAVTLGIVPAIDPGERHAVGVAHHITFGIFPNERPGWLEKRRLDSMRTK